MALLLPGLTLQELTFEHLLWELNKLLPNTIFYSDFSTQFDYHSTITQGISSGGPAPEAKEYNRRVKSSIFNSFVPSKLEPEEEGNESLSKATTVVGDKPQSEAPEENKVNTDPDTIYKLNGRKLTNGHNAGKTIEVNGYLLKVDGNGFPDFTSHPPIALDKDGRKIMMEIDDMQGNYVNDYRQANKLAGFGEGTYDHEIFDNGKYKDYVWHHHQDGKTMILVHKDAHSTERGGYNHAGGVQVCRHNKNYPNNPLYFSSPKKG